MTWGWDCSKINFTPWL